jgi:hypothetical protein
LRVFLSILAALLSSGAVLASEGPCGLATVAEAERVLRGRVVPVPADQIGEETAPYCLWATKGRAREIKLSIWSADELPVLGLQDAESYFVDLEAGARRDDSFRYVDGFGLRAFEVGFSSADRRSDGTVVVLKGGRVLVLDFVGVDARDAQPLAALVATRAE